MNAPAAGATGPPSPALVSLVVPAYNEAAGLETHVRSMLEYCDQQQVTGPLLWLRAEG